MTMMKPALGALLTSCALLAACSHPAPVDSSLTALPAPPSGPAQLYLDTTGALSAQSRTGDCVKTACYVFKGDRWQPLEAAQAHTTALLTIDEATGSHYSEGLWRQVASGRAILINASAGDANISAGQFDGLRIGLRDGTHITYVTAYPIENGSTLQSVGRCLSGVGCAKALGSGLYLSAVDASVVAASGSAWLLQRRPDRSANLVDLYAILAKPDKILCLPGLALDTAGAWAGPAETALSPDLFVSRKIDPASADAERRSVLDKCLHAAKPAKAG